METIFKYMETPQYLRKALIGQSEHLKCAGLLEPLAIPSHSLKSDICPYREGVCLECKNDYALFDIGLDYECKVNICNKIEKNARRTIKLDMSGKKLYAQAFDPIHKKKLFSGQLTGEIAGKRVLSGKYWGFKVIKVEKFRDVITKNKFSFIMGTSDVGQDFDEHDIDQHNLQNTLITLGGIDGYDPIFKSDIILRKYSPEKFFDAYLNFCPKQGTRTIRTEEAVAIILAKIDTKFI